MLTNGLIAIEATILATAVPTIVGDLGGFTEFPWLFSVYLLAQAVSVPVYAKLADVVGRKPIIMVGIGLFLTGSILAGFAWSMPALIAFRAIQGLGAGAVLPMAITIVGDIYSVRERAKVQGYLASVWAISSVIGPALGGVFSEFLTWRWIFFVNIPLSILAIWMLARAFRERVTKAPHSVDYAGAATLTIALTLLILGVLEGGQAWTWDSPVSITVFSAGAIALGVFVVVERRAAEPVLPLWVMSRRLLGTTAVISLGAGAILMGLTSYVPTFLEGSIGVSPLVGGFALAALTLGWPLAAAISGRFYLRLGFRPTALIGSAIVTVGVTGMAITAGTPSVAIVASGCFVVGFGMGLMVTPSLVAAQSSVEWNERGVVTGTNLFARSIGSAVGVAIFGAIANAVFRLTGTTEHDPAGVQAAGASVFASVAVLSVVVIAAAVAMPRDGREQDSATRRATSEPEPTAG